MKETIGEMGGLIEKAKLSKDFTWKVTPPKWKESLEKATVKQKQTSVSMCKVGSNRINTAYFLDFTLKGLHSRTACETHQLIPWQNEAESGPEF